jgi:hypothetical protein
VEISNEPAVSAIGVTAERDGWGQLIITVGDIHTAESFPDSLTTRESARYLRQLPQSRVAMATGPAPRLLVVVQLSSERVRQAVPQDCSFAERQASPPALLVVVHLSSQRTLESVRQDGCFAGRQGPGPALLLIVRLSSEGRAKRCARTARLSTSRSLPVRSWSSSERQSGGRGVRRQLATKGRRGLPFEALSRR